MKKLFKNLFLDLFLLFLLTFFCVILSFFFTNTNIDGNLLKLYITNKEIVLLNLFPLFLFHLILYFIGGKLWKSSLFSFFFLSIMGLANISKLHYRYENLRFSDLGLVKEALNMMGNDYSIVFPKYFLPMILSMGCILFLLYFFRKYKLPTKIRISGAILSLLFLFFSKNILLSPEIYGNHKVHGFNEWVEVEQEKAHGLIYSFVYSINEVIVQKPERYNENEIMKIWNSYEDEKIPKEEKINIIAIMLESYNDFSQFGLPFSKYPYESFDWIKENSMDGLMVNNMFGGGTAFVERYFLRGSYYYSRYYKPVNSYVWYFKNQGYKTISMHPNNGGFYNRRNINPKLGFDEFYYMENYFKDFDKGGKHFMDKNLYTQILKNYRKNTKDNTPYFNFTVTMQNHGPYDSSSLEEEYISRENFSTDESYYIVNNYLHGVHLSGDALKEFLEELDKEEKPTLVIAFGDHNPFLGEEDIGYKDLNIDVTPSTIPTYLHRSRTPYIFWGNQSLKENFGDRFQGRGPEISAQFLMNTAFEQLHWKGPKYMQIVREELPKVDIFNDRLTRSQGEFFTSESNKYKEIEDFVKNLDYYNNKMFYYDPLWKEK